MTVTLIFTSIDFYDLYLSVFFFVLLSLEKIYHTYNIVFDRISKHLEVNQKYSTTTRVFNSLLSVLGM